jgi:hypothetical protein
MRSIRNIAVLALPLALLVACYSIPGITSPIPQMSPEQKEMACAQARKTLSEPEQYRGSHKDQEAVLKMNNCLAEAK